MEPLTGQDLEQVAKHTKEIAGGMDMWTPADFTFQPRAAFYELARLLNMIEDGVDWLARANQDIEGGFSIQG